MQWISANIASVLVGIGIILLLTLLTRGSLRGKAGEAKGGCEGCTCGGECDKKARENGPS